MRIYWTSVNHLYKLAQMLNRKQLPLVARLNQKFDVDIESLISYLHQNNMLDFGKYKDIQYSSGSNQSHFVLANQFSKNNFFKEEEAANLEGEFYRQLYLTDIPDEYTTQEYNNTHHTIFSRTKRLNPKSKLYCPVADEILYSKRNSLVHGPLEKILDIFGPEVKRVRLSVIMPHFSIKPHIDYDPSYITRIHLPLITSPNARIGFKHRNTNHYFHLPSDGAFYFLNTGVVHWAENLSDFPRLHLIIDVHDQFFLENFKTVESSPI